ncbi:FG-GAP repeat domain-containing protein [Candidatus Omnitrophota bacterium]
MGHGNTDVDGSTFDINGDGWIDMFSGSTILLNPGKPREAQFNVHTMGTTYSHDSEFADINGDGKMDAITNWDNAGLFWYEIPDDPTRIWTSHPIVTSDTHKIHGGVSPNAVGDMDGDGDADVVTSQAWYENTDGNGLTWSQHMNISFGEHHKYGLAVKTWVLDMDMDGDNDFVQAEADNPTM